MRPGTLTLLSISTITAALIDCGGSAMEWHRAFLFNSGEGGDSVVDGFTVKNGYVNGFGGAMRRSVARC